MIRLATFNDLTNLVEMCEDFWTHSTFDEPFDRESVCPTLVQGIEQDSIVVYERDERLLGFLALVIGPLIVNHKVLQATELAWWVDPSVRGSTVGVKILDKAEKVAKNKGCKYFNAAYMMSSMPESIKSMYERKGYTQSEVLYTKELS